MPAEPAEDVATLRAAAQVVRYWANPRGVGGRFWVSLLVHLLERSATGIEQGRGRAG